MSSLYRISIDEIISKLKEVRELNRAKTDLLYLEIHNEVLVELVMNPDLDLYIGSNTRVVGRETIENLLGVKIFTHNDNDKRYIMTITYRTDFLIGDKNDSK